MKRQYASNESVLKAAKKVMDYRELMNDHSQFMNELELLATGLVVGVIPDDDVLAIIRLHGEASDIDWSDGIAVRQMLERNGVANQIHRIYLALPC